MSIAPGTRLGPYEILTPPGAGGMGEVYRARDTRLGRDVAVKVLPSSYSDDKERLQRFEQEACAAGAPKHPNILVIHHIDTYVSLPYIVSELLQGQTLRDRLHGDAPPQRKAIDYGLQVAHEIAAPFASKLRRTCKLRIEETLLFDRWLEDRAKAQDACR